MESRFSGLLPRRDRKKTRQVRAASYRTLAELAGPHRVASQCAHHKKTIAPDCIQRQTSSNLCARGKA